MANISNFISSPTPGGGGGGGSFSPSNSISGQTLLVGGGGGAGSGSGGSGGGGGGGLLDLYLGYVPGEVYVVSIGTGGSGSNSITTPGSGTPTYIIGPGIGRITALGGGGGGNTTGELGSGGGEGLRHRGVGSPTRGDGNIFQGFTGGGLDGGAAGGGGGAGGPGLRGSSGGPGLRSTVITQANATSATVGEVISGEVWFSGGGQGSSGSDGNGRGTNSGGGARGTTNTSGDAGVAIIKLATSSFTSLSFTEQDGTVVTPGSGAAVQTLAQGNDTVVIFRSGTTLMTITA